MLNIMKKSGLVILIIVVIPLHIIIVTAGYISSFATVNEGERGVIFNYYNGVQMGVLPPGEYFNWPFLQKILTVDITDRIVEISSESKMAENHNFNVTARIYYHIDTDRVDEALLAYSYIPETRVLETKPTVQLALDTVTARIETNDMWRGEPTPEAYFFKQLNRQLRDEFLVVDGIQIIKIDIQSP